MGKMLQLRSISHAFVFFLSTTILIAAVEIVQVNKDGFSDDQGLARYTSVRAPVPPAILSAVPT